LTGDVVFTHATTRKSTEGRSTRNVQVVNLCIAYIFIAGSPEKKRILVTG
jgi:hypothetical protein